jgi:hypothetical protein
VSLASTVFGGLLFWVAAFAGLGVASVGIGAAATLIPQYAFARKEPPDRPFLFMLVFAFAFVLFTWPILGLGVGYVNYLVTGQALGE